MGLKLTFLGEVGVKSGGSEWQKTVRRSGFGRAYGERVTKIASFWGAGGENCQKWTDMKGFFFGQKSGFQN